MRPRVDLAGHLAQRCELAAAPISLVFLGYPDGGIRGDRPDSLLRLWQGEIDHADTVAERVAHYDRAGLVATLAELITSSQPSVIRTLEVSAIHGEGFLQIEQAAARISAWLHIDGGFAR